MDDCPEELNQLVRLSDYTILVRKHHVEKNDSLRIQFVFSHILESPCGDMKYRSTVYE